MKKTASGTEIFYIKNPKAVFPAVTRLLPACG